MRLSQLSTDEQNDAAENPHTGTPNPTVTTFHDPTVSNEYFNNAIIEIEKGTERLPFDTSRCSEIKEWSANTTKYDVNKSRIYYKWLRTIAEFGGEKLGKLGSLELEDKFGEKFPLLISFL